MRPRAVFSKGPLLIGAGFIPRWFFFFFFNFSAAPLKRLRRCSRVCLQRRAFRVQKLATRRRRHVFGSFSRRFRCSAAATPSGFRWVLHTVKYYTHSCKHSYTHTRQLLFMLRLLFLLHGKISLNSSLSNALCAVV